MLKDQPQRINDSMLANSVYELLKETGDPLSATVIMKNVLPIKNLSSDLAYKLVEIILKEDSRFILHSQDRWTLAKNISSAETIADLDFIVLDVEITGHSQSAQIIEIAAYYLQQMDIVEQFCTFVNPGRSIYSKVLHKPTGEVGRVITTDLLHTAPVFSAIVPDLFSFIRNNVLVAHNAQFDLRMINLELQRLGYGKVVNKTIDTLKITRKMIRGIDTQKLPNLAYYFGVPMAEHHLAREDAKVLARIFPRLIDLLQENGFEHFDQMSPFLISL